MNNIQLIRRMLDEANTEGILYLCNLAGYVGDAGSVATVQAWLTRDGIDLGGAGFSKGTMTPNPKWVLGLGATANERRIAWLHLQMNRMMTLDSVLQRVRCDADRRRNAYICCNATETRISGARELVHELLLADGMDPEFACFGRDGEDRDTANLRRIAWLKKHLGL